MTVANPIPTIKPTLSNQLKKEDAGKTDNSNPANGKSAFSQILDKQRDEQMDIFLRMFLTQVQHQDPMKPMDPNEMSRSLMSFHSVAQQSKMNDNLEKMIASQERQEAMAAKSYLNKEIQYHGDEFTFDGVGSEISLTWPQNAEGAKLIILDAGNNPITHIDVTAESALKPIRWDGSDIRNPEFKFPAGQYHAKFFAQDKEGNQFTVPLIQKGVVNQIGYNTEGDEYALLVGGTPVSISDVASIRKLPSSELVTLTKRNDEVFNIVNERLPQKVIENVQQAIEPEEVSEMLALPTVS